MEFDYIIIGCGLAGISFAEVLSSNRKSFVVLNDNSQNSTQIAGGLYNPVVLKRFTEAWQATRQINQLDGFYQALETKLQIKLKYEVPVIRKFFSIEEQNNWFTAADKSNLTKFLSSKIIDNKYQAIRSSFGFGKVNHSGYVDTALLQEKYLEHLAQKNLLINETFDYAQLTVLDNEVQYKDIKAKKVVFAEGFGLHQNPFFKYLPLDGTKGELLVIKAPDLQIDSIINANVFILPIGNDLFKVGATYNWSDKTDVPTDNARKELVDNLKELITCNFEIISQLAGVRPTVNDRRPLLGQHPNYKNLYILNGLGTRGVMLGPDMAKKLYDFIENEIKLEKEINITRYASRFLPSDCN